MITYTVFMIYEVDAPSLRPPGMWRPAAGHTFVERTDNLSFRGAVHMYETALRGEWDFGSEFVARLYVQSFDDGRARCVRKRVERDTPAFRFERFMARLDALEHLAWRRTQDPSPVAGVIETAEEQAA